MAQYKVAEGQELIHSGRRYAAGEIAPNGVAADALCAVGVLVSVEGEEPPSSSEEAQEPASEAKDGFDPSDPSTVSNVPLRALGDVLEGIDDLGLLRSMLEADRRSGGRSAIRDRINDLE